ncbi:MAG: GTPase ObgE [Anaerolineae bacterium]|nr:GTPase ObgE [Anaerolineae bacterium]
MIDEVKVFVKSGDGGDGMIHFRREKFVPRGGPDGGDGGHGGDVVLVVNPKLSTLSNFQHRAHFSAQPGGRGGANNRTGASASHYLIEVPPGTVVRDEASGALLGDLVNANDRLIVAKGGRGGRGNTRFKSASHQAPRYAEKGMPSEERWLRLELKLIADVGLVGMPNAGKSTLLSVISNARPKIASYPFTTLEPNLGVVRYDDRDLVVADIPGLIEGAHEGVGLGHAFLRHVQRTRLLVHLLNGENPDPLADYNQINIELALYDEKLGEKPQIVVFNKMDLPDAQERWPQVQAALKQRGVQPLAISAATQDNVQTLIREMFRMIDALPDEPVTIAEVPIYELPEDEFAFEISRDEDGTFRVTGKRIERAAAMTYWDYDEAIARFQTVLETLGITKALEAAGVEVGDTVFIGDFELEWTE